MKYPDDFINKIICGDCFKIIKNIPSNSIDTILTDPPYGLEFMNKKWDKFPLRDRGKRLTGSGKPTEARGFAKNVAYGYSKKTLSAYQEFSYRWAKECFRVAKPGAMLFCFGGTRTYHRMTCGIEDAGWQIFDCIFWVYGEGFSKSLNISKQFKKKGYEKKAKEWLGWGTALKPAVEPIVCARKPNEGSYIENALKWGVAGLNINGGKIGTETISTHNAPKGTFAGGEQNRGSDTNSYKRHQGRYPANIIFNEESAKMLDKQSSGSSRFFYCAKASKVERNMGCEELKNKKFTAGNYSQSPVCKDCGKTLNGINDHSKCSGEVEYREMKSKNTGNNHPTVKPLKLMEYLCLLTKTPTGGIVLDPFAGSGTTGIACKKIGRDYILIEKEEEYCEIAKRRIKAQIKSLF